MFPNISWIWAAKISTITLNGLNGGRGVCTHKGLFNTSLKELQNKAFDWLAWNDV